MTTRFNANIVIASRRMKEIRADAGPSSDSGKRFTSQIWTDYENQVVRDLIKVEFESGRISRSMPEYVEETGAFAISGSVLKTPSQWHFHELITTDGLVLFAPLKRDILRITKGADGLIIPSYTMPVFWEEAGKLFVNPATRDGANAWSVIGRYVKTHQDIVVNTASTDNGNYSVGAGGFDLATKVLTIDMHTPFVAADINKRIFFRDSTKVYSGLIDTVVSVRVVTLRGDGLPTVTITLGSVADAILSSLSADPNDLILNTIWDGAIIRGMVDLALQDSIKNQPASS